MDMNMIKLKALFSLYEEEIDYVIKVKKGDHEGTILPIGLKLGTCSQISRIYNELKGESWKYSKNPVISIYSAKDEKHFRDLLGKREKEATKEISNLDYKWMRLIDEGKSSEAIYVSKVRNGYGMALKAVDLLKGVLDERRFYNVDRKTLEEAFNKVPSQS